MINKALLIELYLSGKSTPQISEMLSTPKSTVRARLLSAGVLRSRADAVRLAEQQGRIPHHGNKRKLTAAEREHLKEKALERGRLTAKGTTIKPSGYIELTRGKNKGRCVHRAVMEEFLGTSLQPNEHVHHRDGDKTNNNIENLEVLSIGDHVRLHRVQDTDKRKRNEKGQFV
jgi:hypothetical protein